MKKPKLVNLKIRKSNENTQNGCVAYFTLKYKNYFKNYDAPIVTSYEEIINSALRSADDFARYVISKEYGDDSRAFIDYYDEVLSGIEFDNTPIEISNDMTYIPLSFSEEASKENVFDAHYAEVIFNRDYVGGRALVRVDNITTWDNLFEYINDSLKDYAEARAFQKFYFLYGEENADYNQYAYGGDIEINEDLSEVFSKMVNNVRSIAVIG